MFLTGFIIPLTANPHAGLASHLEGVMNGTFLLALGCAWSELRLGALAGRFVHALLTFGAWANWAATLLSASAGDQQGNAAGGAGHAGTPLRENLVFDPRGGGREHGRFHLRRHLASLVREAGACERVFCGIGNVTKRFDSLATASRA